ncbi:hypothetical protein P170DRAFT_432177 [Aspergillus steynii IBT 23096]|uniref:Uncharacterized protein n=1 Tax=Aspergillus steynii IBT 23096 TaxID=1392250 RepID=A0A2I2GNT1_9EURO|nr:uncharacterized protein P170DRAFT_432177 [Aspergillus steynii IBT 23096]PLB54535.1 hypothetical protein P170DRAFT_432177 [Aspergillus steynii IBT 23096]
MPRSLGPCTPSILFSCGKSLPHMDMTADDGSTALAQSDLPIGFGVTRPFVRSTLTRRRLAQSPSPKLSTNSPIEWR